MKIDEAAFIHTVAYQLGYEPKDISMDSKYRDLGSDSLDDIELTMIIEEDYNIEFEDGVESYLGGVIETVGDLFGIVKYTIDNKKTKINHTTVDDYMKQKEKNMTMKRPTTLKTTVPVTTPAATSTTTTTKKKPANHNKRWKDEDRGVLLYRYAQGVPVTIIAKELGRTKVSILGQLAELNLVQFDRDQNAYYTVPTLVYQF